MNRNLIPIVLTFFFIAACGKDDATKTGKQNGGAGTPTPATGLGTSALKPQGSVPNIVFAKAGLSARLDFLAPPKEDVNSPFEIRFWRAGGNSQTGPFIDPGFLLNSKTVHLEMHGEGMNHGSKPTTVSRFINDAMKPETTVSFIVGNVIFSMTGKWNIQVDLRQGENVVDSASFEYFQN